MNNAILSIRSRLIFWLIIPLTLLSLATLAVMSYFISNKSSTLFDHNLLAAAHTIEQRLVVKQGKIILRMPYFVLDIMESTSGEKIFYRIQRSDGEVLAGFKGLKKPDIRNKRGKGQHKNTRPIFYSTQFAGNELRAVYLPIKTQLTKGQQHSYIILAESLQGRQSFTDSILYILMVVTLFWVTLSIICAILAVNKGLRPLRRIRHSLLKRSVHDLSPLNTIVPKEVQELILSINLLMSRVREGIEHMRHFNADVSHQLRTPLAEIKTLAELATDEPDKDNIKASLRQIEELTDFLSRTTQQLLHYAKTNKSLLDDSHLTDLNLTHLCQQIALKLAPKVYKNGQELAFIKASPTDIHIIGDAIMLEGLLTNLVENACLYGQSQQEKPYASISIRVGNDNNKPFVEVEDQGFGIPAEHIDQVTKRFYRVDKNKKGSGLGLAIAEQICEFHQAQFELSNVRPQGLRALITFKETHRLQ
jgi:two-component system sensor histidine kinase TctE